MNQDEMFKVLLNYVMAVATSKTEVDPEHLLKQIEAYKDDLTEIRNEARNSLAAIGYDLGDFS